MQKHLLITTIALMAAAYAESTLAQVRQANPEDMKAAGNLQEVPSPMLIDISLGEGATPTGKHRDSLYVTKPGTMRAYTDAAGFVCDKARVSVILVRYEVHREKVALEATPSLSTDYLRQDVNLRVKLLSGEKEVRSHAWDRLTIGNNKSGSAAALTFFAAGIGTSRPKAMTAKWEMSQAEWESLWKDGQAPTLRVILEIVD